jgi:hypothetical protein
MPAMIPRQIEDRKPRHKAGRVNLPREKAVLSNSTIEIVDQYWSSSLGCPREALYERHTLLVPDGESNNFHGIYCFLRSETLIIAVSADLLEVFRLRAESWSQAEVLDRERFQRLIDHPIDRIIGPAFIGYTDRVAFRPVFRRRRPFFRPERPRRARNVKRRLYYYRMGAWWKQDRALARYRYVRRWATCRHSRVQALG